MSCTYQGLAGQPFFTAQRDSANLTPQRRIAGNPRRIGFAEAVAVDGGITGQELFECGFALRQGYRKPCPRGSAKWGERELHNAFVYSM